MFGRSARVLAVGTRGAIPEPGYEIGNRDRPPRWLLQVEQNDVSPKLEALQLLVWAKWRGGLATELHPWVDQSGEFGCCVGGGMRKLIWVHVISCSRSARLWGVSE